MCKKCNDTGEALIETGAPDGWGYVKGYCDCECGESLAIKEICDICGEHKDMTPEKKVYTAYETDFRYCYDCMKDISKSTL